MEWVRKVRPDTAVLADCGLVAQSTRQLNHNSHHSNAIPKDKPGSSQTPGEEQAAVIGVPGKDESGDRET